MHAITGKDGAFKVAGTLATGKFQKWRVTVKNENVVDRGGGEGWQSRVPLFNDWEFEATVLVTSPSAGNYTPDYSANVGNEIRITALYESGDTTPAFDATGLVEQFESTNDITQPTQATVRVVCSQGIAPTNE